MNMVPLSQCWREWVDCDDAAERMAEQIADGTAETPTRALRGKESRLREGGLRLSPSARPVASDMAAEAEVTKQCIAWLNDEEGWRTVRTNSGTYRGRARSFVKVGEVGMCDYLCLDYWHRNDKPAMFWLEVKAPGKQISKAQRVWIKAEEEKGATVIIADSLDSLQAQYAEAFG